MAQDILDALNDETDITPEIIEATNITIELARAGKLQALFNYNSFDAEYQSIVTRFLSTQSNVFPWQQYALAIAFNMVQLKEEHPNWGDTRLLWEATKELIHTGLDIIGLMPVVGEFADLSNAFLYSIEGNGTMAALSYMSAIPIVGWYSAGVKMAKKTIFNSSGGKVVLRFTKLSNGKVWFGSRGQLRKVLGLAVGDAKQAHHIIPWEFINHDLVQTASKKVHDEAFHMNELLNGIALDKSVHVEGMVHQAYNSAIIQKLDKIVSDYAVNGVTLTPDLARMKSSR